MNRFHKWMATTLAILALIMPANAWGQRPGPFPLPPAGPLDDPAEPGTDTEFALVGSWVAHSQYQGTPGYYHLQIFKHAVGTFQDQQGNYLGENRWDWSAESMDGSRFVLNLGNSSARCAWGNDDHSCFTLTAKSGKVIYFYRNP